MDLCVHLMASLGVTRAALRDDVLLELSVSGDVTHTLL